jgi:hypothetical protein
MSGISIMSVLREGATREENAVHRVGGISA